MARKKTGGDGGGEPEGKADDLLDQIVARILASDNPQAALGSMVSQLSAYAAANGGSAGTDAFAARRNRPIPLPAAPSSPVLLTIRVDLVGARPPIWRRVRLRGELTLEQVHHQLQAAMGWLDGHLHRFSGPGVGAWEVPHFVTELDEGEGDDQATHERDARLDQVLCEPGDTIHYIYDFGDDWVHRLRLESVRAATPDDPVARCLAGRRACPPEDVGGIHTWNELADALRADPDPTHLRGDLAHYADWLAPGIAPDEFDLEEADEALRWADGHEADVEDPPGQARSAFAAVGENAGQAGAGFVADLPAAHPALAHLLRKAHPLAAMALRRLAATAELALHEDPAPTGAQLAATLRPWSCVLQTAGADGIPLTKAGWMAPAACERISRESELALSYGKGNREQHTPGLMLLRSECLRAKLIRTLKGHLVLTPLGRRAIDDDQVLADAVAASLASDPDDFARDARVVALLLLASGWLPEPTADEEAELPSHFFATEQNLFRAEVARHLTSIGWRDGDGPISQYGPRVSSEILTLLTAGMPYPALHRQLPRSAGVRHLARLALFPGVT